MNTWMGRRLLLIVAAHALCTGQASRDAIVIPKAMTASTIAEVFVRDGEIRVELEIGGRDLDAFSNLMPDGLHERFGFEVEPLAERLPRFLREDLVFRAGGAVGHWGQIHQRRNRYEAEIEMRPVDGAWKVTGLELLGEERLG